MMGRTRPFTAFVIALVMVMAPFFIAHAEAANAFLQNAANMTCDGEGNFGGEMFSISIVSGGCTNEAAIFGNIICNFVAIMNEVLGTLYCGMQAFMTPIVGTLIVLYVAIFGVQLLMGAVQLTLGEVVLRLLKLTAVWMFATQSAWGIGILYNFFIGFSLSGIQWTLGSIWTGTTTSNLGTMNGLFGEIDSMLYEVIANIFSNKAELLTFFLMFSVICPPVFFLAAAWLWYTIKIFMRTMLSFMLGVSAIAFLIAMSPIFLSLMLFKTTVHFFETWIKYLISYSLQIIIVFACIALWLTVSMQFTGFLQDLSTVVVSYAKASDTGAKVTAENTRGICPLQFTNTTTGPRVQCVDSYVKNPDPNRVVAPSKIVSQQDFIYYLIYHLLALMIISYSFARLLEDSHHIATSLAGPSDIAPLGGGGGAFAGAGNTFSMISGAANKFTPGGRLGGGADDPKGGIVGRIASMVIGKR